MATEISRDPNFYLIDEKKVDGYGNLRLFNSKNDSHSILEKILSFPPVPSQDRSAAEIMNKIVMALPEKVTSGSRSYLDLVSFTHANQAPLFSPDQQAGSRLYFEHSQFTLMDIMNELNGRKARFQDKDLYAILGLLLATGASMEESLNWHNFVDISSLQIVSGRLQLVHPCLNDNHLRDLGKLAVAIKNSGSNWTPQMFSEKRSRTSSQDQNIKAIVLDQSKKVSKMIDQSLTTVLAISLGLESNTVFFKENQEVHEDLVKSGLDKIQGSTDGTLVWLLRFVLLEQEHNSFYALKKTIDSRMGLSSKIQEGLTNSILTNPQAPQQPGDNVQQAFHMIRNQSIQQASNRGTIESQQRNSMTGPVQNFNQSGQTSIAPNNQNALVNPALGSGNWQSNGATAQNFNTGSGVWMAGQGIANQTSQAATGSGTFQPITQPTVTPKNPSIGSEIIQAGPRIPNNQGPIPLPFPPAGSNTQTSGGQFQPSGTGASGSANINSQGQIGMPNWNGPTPIPLPFSSSATNQNANIGGALPGQNTSNNQNTSYEYYWNEQAVGNLVGQEYMYMQQNGSANPLMRSDHQPSNVNISDRLVGPAQQPLSDKKSPPSSPQRPQIFDQETLRQPVPQPQGQLSTYNYQQSSGQTQGPSYANTQSANCNLPLHPNRGQLNLNHSQPAGFDPSGYYQSIMGQVYGQQATGSTASQQFGGAQTQTVITPQNPIPPNQTQNQFSQMQGPPPIYIPVIPEAPPAPKAYQISDLSKDEASALSALFKGILNNTKVDQSNPNKIKVDYAQVAPALPDNRFSSANFQSNSLLHHQQPVPSAIGNQVWSQSIQAQSSQNQTTGTNQAAPIIPPLPLLPPLFEASDPRLNNVNIQGGQTQNTFNTTNLNGQSSANFQQGGSIQNGQNQFSSLGVINQQGLPNKQNQGSQGPVFQGQNNQHGQGFIFQGQVNQQGQGQGLFQGQASQQGQSSAFQGQTTQQGQSSLQGQTGPQTQSQGVSFQGQTNQQGLPNQQAKGVAPQGQAGFQFNQNQMNMNQPNYNFTYGQEIGEFMHYQEGSQTTGGLKNSAQGNTGQSANLAFSNNTFAAQQSGAGVFNVGQSMQGITSSSGTSSFPKLPTPQQPGPLLPPPSRTQNNVVSEPSKEVVLEMREMMKHIQLLEGKIASLESKASQLQQNAPQNQFNSMNLQSSNLSTNQNSTNNAQNVQRNNQPSTTTPQAPPQNKDANRLTPASPAQNTSTPNAQNANNVNKPPAQVPSASNLTFGSNNQPPANSNQRPRGVSQPVIKAQPVFAQVDQPIIENIPYVYDEAGRKVYLEDTSVFSQRRVPVQSVVHQQPVITQAAPIYVAESPRVARVSRPISVERVRTAEYSPVVSSERFISKYAEAPVIVQSPLIVPQLEVATPVKRLHQVMHQPIEDLSYVHYEANLAHVPTTSKVVHTRAPPPVTAPGIRRKFFENTDDYSYATNAHPVIKSGRVPPQRRAVKGSYQNLKPRVTAPIL